MEDRKASVAIIGGGIVGASIAYNLTLKGFRDLVLLERGRFGSGSTSASLGGFRHQFSNELSVKLSKESIRIIEDLKNLTGYDPLLKRDGYLFIAETEKSMDQLKRNRALAIKLGVNVDLLEKAELEKIFPFYMFHGVIGGTLCMEDGHASTGAALQGFVSKAKENGADLNENAVVTKMEKLSSTNSFLLSTSIGRVESDMVVIACGAYSGVVGRLASVDIPIKPYPRKILITHPFHEGIPKEIPLIIDVDSTLGIGREGSGILMADNLEAEPSFELIFPPEYEERVISAAVERVPALRSASVSYTNSGLYEMTPDSNPIVGEISESPGLYCCAGFAGHGFMHAPIIGELMSEILSGSRPHLDISGFDIARFSADEKEESKTGERLII